MNFLLFSSAHAQTITPASPGFDFGGYGIWLIVALVGVGIFLFLKRNPSTVSSLTDLLHKQAETHAVVAATVPQALAATPAPVDVQAQINAAVAAALAANRPGTPIFTPIPAATIKAVPAYGFDDKGQLLPGFMWDTRANGGKGGALTKAESDALSGISPAQAAAQEAAGAAAGNPGSYTEEQNLLAAIQWDSPNKQPDLDLLATFGYTDGSQPTPVGYRSLIQASANANPLRNAANSMRRGLSPEQAVLASDNQVTQDQADKLKVLLVKYGQA